MKLVRVVAYSQESRIQDILGAFNNNIEFNLMIGPVLRHTHRKLRKVL